MNYTLLSLIFVLALCQPTHDRMLAATLYGVINLAHWVLVSWWINDFGYYVTAAVASFLTVYAIKYLPHITATATSLARVSLVEIVLNFGGLILWGLYQGPGVYDFAFTIILVWTVIILIRKDQADEMGGDLTVGGWGDYLRIVAGAGLRGVHRDQGAATK